jgi:hypothetical protein
MRFGAWMACLLLACPLAAFAQQPTETTVVNTAPKAAEALYLQLRSVGLDKARVYKVRDASLDREALHVTLDDGTIAFTEDVAGHVTGAFFEGEGEVLLVPANQVERESMALFTGAAILEERFVSAYFRFNDDTFAEMQPALRPYDGGLEFVSQWNQTARNLAESDALRLLLSFSRMLPVSGDAPTPAVSEKSPTREDRLLHARVQGRKLGTFDLYFDSGSAEQMWAGQLRTTEGQSYYDVWTSFSPNQQGSRQEGIGIVAGEEGVSDDLGISGYHIRSNVKPPTQLDCEASLQMEVRQGGQRAVFFELSRFLQVKEVTADGHPVEFIHNQALEGTQLSRRGNDLVAVVFPQPLRVGQKIELRFVYGGEVISEAGGGLLYVGARGTWYPNRGLTMSDFDLEFHYPAGWTLLATGKPTDTPPAITAEASTQASDQMSHWVTERPIPVAGFNLGKYTRAVAHAGNTLVATYAAGVERAFPKTTTQAVVPDIPGFPGSRNQTVEIVQPPPSPAKNAQPIADQSARAIDFFARCFGPYPYSELALTQMPGTLSQGWPGLIFLSSFSFLTPSEKSGLHMTAVDTAISESVVAHETAHQWWGDLIVWRGYRDQWIFEALANYSSLMLLESENPSQFRAVMERYRQDLLQKNKDGAQLLDAGPVTLGSRLSSSHFPDGYDAISYGRGTWLFHMLRNMMRDGSPKTPPSRLVTDEPFVRALRRVRERYEGKAMTTRELLRVFEEDLPPSMSYEGRKSLDWFYQSWVNGTALPHLELQGTKFVDKGHTTAVSGTILQRSAPKELVTLVPVYAVVGGKNVLAGQVFADGPETQFHLTAPAGTRKLVLDPNQTVLSRAH